MAVQTLPASASDGVLLRPMTPDDVAAAHALSADLRWPHRAADWEQALRFAEGVVAERDDRIVGTALRFRWGPRHATVGLVIVEPASQGRRIGARLMQAALEGLDGCTVLLHATPEGRGLYERLGFRRSGELRQHQGLAQPAPLVALGPHRRLRPAGSNDLPRLQALDGQARGMPRPALVAELLATADATVVLDEGDHTVGYACLRRFGRGHQIGPVVAPDVDAAKALIAHLSGLNAGRFTRIDIDVETGLAEWIESLGLPRVDVPTTMWRGTPPAAGGPLYVSPMTQAIG